MYYFKFYMQINFYFVGRVCVSFYNNFDYNRTILSHKQYYHTISNET